MGSSCSGDRTSGASNNADVWDKGFSAVRVKSSDILSETSEYAKSGLDHEEIERRTKQEISQLTLLTIPFLEQLWKRYDKNGDNSMSAEEMKPLVQDYLIHSQAEIPIALERIMRQHFQQSGLSEAEVRMYLQNPELSEALRSTSSTMLHRVHDWMKNIDDVSTKMHRRIDTNKDGQVSKQEFLQGFPAACDHVCNFSVVKQTLFSVSKIEAGA